MNRSCGSRQTVTTMVLTIAALSGLVFAEPGRHLGLNDLRRGFTEALERADYDKAIVIGTELMSRTPKSALDAYNLACAYALNGKKTNAAAWLKTSAENGWSRLQQTRADDDLVNIRTESGYHEALKRIEKNHDADFKIFKKKADAHEPVIITPPAYDPSKPAPLIVVLHGFGGRADPIAKTWEQAAAEVGAVLLAPRAVRSVVDRGYQWGTIEEAEYVVTRALERVRKSHRIDTDRVILSGFSQGGFMSIAIGMRHAEMFRGVIPIAAVYRPFATPEKPLSQVKAPRFYVMIGDRDFALRQSRRAADDLQAAGITVEFKVFPKTGHRFPVNTTEELLSALRFVLAE